MSEGKVRGSRVGLVNDELCLMSVCNVAVRCGGGLTSCSLTLQMLRNCLRQLTPEEGEAEGQGERDGEEEGTAGSEGEGVLCLLT